uniref:Delta-sarcoglycan n=1 Tax=Oryzias sinensis TaxID=183150 RepID=A0A8C7Z5P6_9TELE
MGNLRITEKGLKLEGDSEFLQPLYAKEIQSKPGRPLFLQSSRNISVNVVNGNKQLLTQLVTGSSGFRAQGRMFEVKSTSGNLLFSADEQEVVVGAERLRVTDERNVDVSWSHLDVTELQTDAWIFSVGPIKGERRGRWRVSAAIVTTCRRCTSSSRRTAGLSGAAEPQRDGCISMTTPAEHALKS